MENVGLHLIDGTPQSFFLDCVHILRFELGVDDLVSDDVIKGFCPLHSVLKGGGVRKMFNSEKTKGLFWSIGSSY